MDLSWKSTSNITQYIPLDQCRDGWLYSIAARNATLGVYRERELGFEIRREKFRLVYRFIEYHWDIGTVKPELTQYGTVKPLEAIEQAPLFEDEKSFIEYMERRYKELFTPKEEI